MKAQDASLPSPAPAPEIGDTLAVRNSPHFVRIHKDVLRGCIHCMERVSLGLKTAAKLAESEMKACNDEAARADDNIASMRAVVEGLTINIS